MKTLLWTLIVAGALQAQTNIVYSWTIKAAPNDTPVTINATQDEAVAVPNWLFSQALLIANAAAPAALTADAASGVTTFSLSAIPAGLVTGNGVCISPSTSNCGITMSTNGQQGNLSLSTGEVARVTAVSGTGPYTVTVTRGSIGTAASYTAGQVVTFIKYGSYSDLSAALLVMAQSAIVQNCSFGAYTTTTQCAALAAAQSALASVH